MKLKIRETVEKDEDFIAKDPPFKGTGSVEDIAFSFYLSKTFEPDSIYWALHNNYSKSFINKVIRKANEFRIYGYNGSNNEI